ncbi:hypothetical protein ACWC98_17585 [Streptomyces goshikiensis]
MMITREQIATATARTVLLGSAALVVQGTISKKRPGRTCMAIRVAFGVLALVTIAHNHRAKQKAADDVNEVYRLGLTHGTNGFVFPRPDSHGQGATAQDAAAPLSAIPSPMGAKGSTHRKAP